MSETSHAPTLPVESQPNKQGKTLSSVHKSVLLSTFCCAQFLEAANNAALFPAIPTLMRSMGITGSQSAWIISAFQLTFASFLLLSGRLSDVYNPKTIFIAGLSLVGILSFCAGFVINKIVFMVLRALIGIASAMIIPSALALLVRVFPDPLEQARAIAVQGGCGAIGDVLGLFIGAILVQYASYHWIFWFAAIVAIPAALTCLFIIPPDLGNSKDEPHKPSTKLECLDPIGILILTASFILFIYAVTGPTNGWASAGVTVPLIISIFLVIGFFYWETLIPSDRAAIPPRTWFYSNFSILFSSALLPFFLWDTLFLAFTTLWQDVFHWTAMSTAAHMVPLGVAAFAASFTGPLSRVLSPKWLILSGLSMVAVATALVAVRGGRPADYWPFVFPAFCLGSAGTMLTFTHTNIAIFQTVPASMAGTVGAIFNGALQIGCAIGLAAFCSIEASVHAADGDHQGYRGRAASFWFVLGIVMLEILAVSYFYKSGADRKLPSKCDDGGDSKTVAGEGRVEKVEVVGCA